ncbi:chemotaxis protein CheA [Pseudomonas sp. NW5]|uniref:chemotaxis protein CheA n=1 Tax=Pseudomonas sp. NW5 TaxID=2934934 RepID=UPI0020206CEB|nr:chemotaxis protein CheA [Pseudomonas sp. NW5]MCL7461885.1 chemotaxis protein CheA [Pseudomonas sp. NW5]
MDITDFYDTFFEEAAELLGDMERYLLELDIEHPDPEHLNAIFRAAHSIKGGAGTFGFDVLQKTTHIFENLLDHLRRGELTLRRDIVDLFLETKDMLQDQLDAYRNSAEPDAEAFARICRVLQQLAEEEIGQAGAPAAAPAAAAPTPAPAPVATSASVAPSEAIEAQDGEARLCVALLGVAEKDRQLLVEELGQFGRIIKTSGDEQRYEVELLSSEEPDDIEAVLCFVVDADQLEICVLGIADSPAAEAAPAPAPTPPAAPVPAAPSSPAASGDDDDLEALFEANQSLFAALHSQGAVEPAGAVAPAAVEPPVVEPPVSTPAPAPIAAPVAPAAPAPSAPAPRAPAAPASPRPAADSKPAAASSESTSLRVPVDKVDQIINLVGELVITQSMLEQTVSQLGGALHGDLVNSMSLLQRNARDLQEAVMSIRMVPMDFVFSRFPRQVRDLAGKLGKDIELVTEGKSTELDKSLVERIIDPLNHLVRNSLDHGIEMPAVREAAGKPRTGRLTLSAQHQGGNIVIDVIDDGAGLDREKILAKARSNGLAVSDNMSDEDVYQLIFAPGFSTAEKVTDVSGRGVGMDVVKRNIQSLGGHVQILSRKGQGTTTRIVLPLTLAILDGMSIRAANEIFILPLSAVLESLQPRSEDIYSMAGTDQLLKVREEYLPLVALHQVFSVAGARTEPTECIAVIVQGEGRRYALLVDELIGQQQVVVKNLETNYRKVPGVSAATILGDGSVALILDIADLYRLSRNPAVTPALSGPVPSAQEKMLS